MTHEVRTPDALRGLLKPITAVRPCPRNPRKDHAVDAIARSLVDFGWHAPIVAREDGEVIVGHGRLLAAASLGLAKVPVLFVDDTDAQAVARMVADNRLTELSSWDLELLQGLVVEGGDLGSWAPDLDLSEELGKLPDFEPMDPGELTDLDKPAPLLKCPECGHEFER